MTLLNHHLLIYIIIFGKFTIDAFLCWNWSGLDLRFLNPVMFAHVLAQPCIEFWENQRKFHFKLVLKELFHTIYELHLLLIVLLPFVTQLQVFRPMGGLTSGVAIMNHPAIAAFLNCEILATSATEPSFFTILLNFFFFFFNVPCTFSMTNTMLSEDHLKTQGIWCAMTFSIKTVVIIYLQGVPKKSSPCLRGHNSQGQCRDVFSSSVTKRIEYYDVALNQFSSASHSHTAGQLKRHFPVWCLLFTYCTASIWLWFILMLNYNSLIELVFTSSIKYPCIWPLLLSHAILILMISIKNTHM